ncbi:Outer membrane protein-like protein [Planctopirus limnophila DSM 3776]|uniref:Outer membrane protein-like protein n=1 Tax=Planctopirus limnophila (strain ATCC 43296 / DSM 3776 / IFAM 1008 / Mu 290) TaxID=521674 RepID=D5SV11_PLAL2|nr:TolC family protein [Planctopirus limnophila]ADG69297.1 Outer membrane protein-like protein [Planctopirus limnophila DSM 3776]
MSSKSRAKYGPRPARTAGLSTRAAIVAVLSSALLVSLCTGCSRNYWRTQADFDTYNEVLKKTRDPRWDLPRVTVEADPRSRFFDPFDPDHEPLPPDDPAAAQYMVRASGWNGYKSWHKLGESLTVENPQWLANFGFSPEMIPGKSNEFLATEKQAADVLDEETPGPLPMNAPNGMTPGQSAQGSPASSQIAALGAGSKATTQKSAIQLVNHEVMEVAQGGAELPPPPVPPVPNADPFPEVPGAAPAANEGNMPAMLPGANADGQVAQNTDDPITTGRQVPTIDRLTLEQAIELANLNNRTYQSIIEDVYLAALDLTFQQFQFNVRYLGFSGEPNGGLEYRNTPGGPNNLAMNGRFGVSQLLPTGGQWVAELTNNTLWLFSGPNQTASVSVLSYSLVQPLLLGAGRKVVMENLTQQERQVLYSVRTLARYRKIFFSDTVINGPGGGFLGLLRQYQQVRNQKDNIQALIVQVERLRALNSAKPQVFLQRVEPFPVDLNPPAEFAAQLVLNPARLEVGWRGPMTAEMRDRLMALSTSTAWREAINNAYRQLETETISLDIAQLVTRLANSENALRSAERSFQDNLDQFKLQLGVPTDFQISIKTDILKQFELIDPLLNARENEVIAFVNDVSLLDDSVVDVATLERVTSLFDEMMDRIEKDSLETVRIDFERVAANEAYRLAHLPTLNQREQYRKNLERDAQIFASQLKDFAGIRERIDIVRSRPANTPWTPAQWRDAVFEIKNCREDLLQVTQSLKVVQLGLRVELIKLADFDLAFDQVVELAMENRLDLMNQRAFVVDSRRQMEVAANRLQAQVNLVAEGDVGTSGGNKPFDFRGTNSQYRAGVQVTAPLDQIIERNNYRESQINYQRARRAYMALEDDVKADVRAEWRQLSVLRQNFETARQTLRFSAMQLDLAIENNNAPTNAAAAGNAGRTNQGGNTGLNLLNALNAILGAQNDLIGIWVDYERNRINIYRDMDIMQVDERGIWIDDIYQNRTSPAASDNNEPAYDTASLPPTAALLVSVGTEELLQRERSSRVRTGRISLPAPGVVAAVSGYGNGSTADSSFDQRNSGAIQQVRFEEPSRSASNSHPVFDSRSTQTGTGQEAQRGLGQMDRTDTPAGSRSGWRPRVPTVRDDQSRP